MLQLNKIYFIFYFFHFQGSTLWVNIIVMLLFMNVNPCSMPAGGSPGPKVG